MRPTPALASLESTPLPDLVLAAGLLFATLVGAVVWIGQLARSRARALDDANRELSRKVVATRSAEASLRKLNQELEARVAARTAELNELVGDLEAFNYSVSHDLRSPLGAIVNFSAVLEEDYRDRLGETGRDVLKRIVSSANLALSLMDGLLAFSRAGREQLKRERIDVEALVRDVISELRPEELGVEVSLGPLPRAWADRTMLRVVLSNLLSNAVKFSRDRADARVEIGARRQDGHIVYHVRDNGVGFDMRFADKLFSVFERLHSSPPFEGSGVGLAIVGRIVRRHGGRVWAQGEPGRGAAFFFSLPGEPGEPGLEEVT